MVRAVLAAAALWLCLTAAAQGAPYEFWLASSREWEAKRGLFLNIENAGSVEECRLEGLRLVAGVGDGKRWTFLSVQPSWQCGREYTAQLDVRQGGATLTLDGQPVAAGGCRLAVASTPLVFNRMASWSRPRAGHIVVQTAFAVRVNEGPLREFHFGNSGLHPRLLFDSQRPRSIVHFIRQGDCVQIEARFCLLQAPDPLEFVPFVDRYGQSRYGVWKGKVFADSDLLQADREENSVLSEWEKQDPFDRFGGYRFAGWTAEATGFYRLVRRDGFWWLITPEGNPCFYTGVCTLPQLAGENTLLEGREQLFEWLPPREGGHAAAWTRGPWGTDAGVDYIAFQVSNLIRTFGEDWRQHFEERLRRRLRAWGFAGAGKWGSLPGLPCVPVLNRTGVPVLARHPDVFDPHVRQLLEDTLRRQIEPRRSDPMVVGWSVGNEFHEIITSSDIRTILRDHPESAAVKALRHHILQHRYGGDTEALRRSWEAEIPPADIEAMRQQYASEYYGFLYRTVKRLDPNHLYFGFWITPGWWENESDWALIAANCDAVGYDLYSDEHLAPVLRRCLQLAARPVFCGEFSFPPFYDGKRGFGLYPLVHARDDRKAGECYQRWLREAAENPYCVGALWFEYRDQPITGGNAPGIPGALWYGERYAFGTVDVTDRPKWDLVSRMREANHSAPRWRLDAAAAGNRR